MPSRWTEWFGETKTLQSLHAANHGGVSMCIRVDAGAGPKVHDPIMLSGRSREYAIEVSPPIGFDLTVQIAIDLDITLGPERKRDQMRRPGAQPMADIVTSHHEIAAIVALTPRDDMNVRVVRIPVIHPDPIKLGAEIPLGLCHQVARKCFQI
jgi:hypothetical protein